MKIINVVGARPNYMKIAPIMDEMKKHSKFNSILVHTGQHYDRVMSKLFFDDLELPAPDIYLEVGSASHAEQTAKIMVKFEKVLLKEKPDLVVVVGDVNSTIACALTAVKLFVPVAHIEAGLRSYDRTMPEEINRMLTDSISDYLFTTCQGANNNLLKEGISKGKIYFVGNVMIDTLLKQIEKSSQSDVLDRLNIDSKNYAVLTLHRPGNVDNKKKFVEILDALEEIGKKIKIIFPIHPRTKKKIEEFDLFHKIKSMVNFKITEALGYLDFLKLMSDAKFVLTDSGGIQEETTILKIPCITLRETTERPITVTEGTNVIVGSNKEKIIKGSLKVINGKEKKGNIPKFWDGKAAERIVNILTNSLLKKYDD